MDRMVDNGILASLGRNGDNYLAHVAQGEMVVPPVISPEVRSLVEAEMMQSGLSPDRYMVGSPEMSINPVTGQPEFFFKKIKKALKKGVKSIGKIAKKAAPFASFIPGVGPLASAAIGAVGGLASGQGLKGALSGGLGGYLGGKSIGGLRNLGGGSLSNLITGKGFGGQNILQRIMMKPGQAGDINVLGSLGNLFRGGQTPGINPAGGGQIIPQQPGNRGGILGSLGNLFGIGGQGQGGQGGILGGLFGGQGGQGGFLGGGLGNLLTIGALGKLATQKGDIDSVGGGFDPAISPVMEQIISESQKSYLEGPRQYDPTERFAYFTPEEQAARERAIKLAQDSSDPFFEKRAKLIGEAEGGLSAIERELGEAGGLYGEAADVARRAARPLEMRELEIRKFMDPYQQAVTDIAKREAREESALRQRDIGSAAAKVGAFGGSRQALLEAEEASSLGERLADIQARGSADAYRSALGAAEREREFGTSLLERGLGREAALSDRLLGLGGSRTDLGLRGYGGLGEMRTGLGGEYGRLGEDLYQRELGSIGILGDVGREGRDLEQRRRDFMYEQFREADPFKRIGEYTSAISPAISAIRPTQYFPTTTPIQMLAGLGTLYGGMRKEGGSVVQKNQGSTVAPSEISKIDEEIKKQKDKLVGISPRAVSFRKPIEEEISKLENQKKILIEASQKKSTPETTPLIPKPRPTPKPTPVPAQNVQQQKPFISRALDTMYDKVDPFSNLDKQERIRIGLGILGQMPELGQSPLSTIAAGASTALSDIAEEADDTDLSNVSRPSSAAFREIDEAILKLTGTETKVSPEKRTILRNIAVNNVSPYNTNNSLYQTQILQLYQDLVEKLETGEIDIDAKTQQIISPLDVKTPDNSGGGKSGDNSDVSAKDNLREGDTLQKVKT